MKLVRALLVATAACVVAAACGRTPFDSDESTPRNPRVVTQPPPRDTGSGIPRRPDPPPPVISPPPPATAPPPPPRLVEDASLPVEDASRTGIDADTGAVTDAARARDATTPNDGSLDGAPDALVSPDCRCPPGDFFIDATMAGTPIHLTAPYVLNIYCEETAVTLGHPACGQVYRLSGCAGPSSAPPCLYMGVDLVRGFILGNFIDANGEAWNILSGSISPNPPVERAATGTFTATLRPRAGGDRVSMSGNFRGCMPLFPPCTS